jgi:hypothetical protein
MTLIGGNNHVNNASSITPKKSNSVLDQTVGDDVVGADTFNPGELAAATGIGAGAGAVAGAIYGGIVAHGKVDAVPIHSKTEVWQEPVTTNKTIGYIPQSNQYFPASHLSDIFGGDTPSSWDRPNVSPNLQNTAPVVEPVPNLDAQGNPIFKAETHPFSGHGTPVPHEVTKTVTTPVLTGSTQHQEDDTHWAERPTGRELYKTVENSDGTTSQVDAGPELENKEILDGVRVNFSANVNNVPVNSAHNTYTEKSWTFDSGVDTGGIIAKDALIGAVGGAIIAGIGDVAKQTLLDRHS